MNNSKSIMRANRAANLRGVRESRNFRIGLGLCVIVGLVLLPVLITAAITSPKATAAGLLAAGAPPMFLRLDPGEDEGGGGGTMTTEQFQAKMLKGVTSLTGKLTGVEGKLKTLEDGSKTSGDDIKSLKDNVNTLTTDVAGLKKSRLVKASGLSSFRSGNGIVGLIAHVSEDCARALAGQFIIHCAASGKLEALSSVSKVRDSLLDEARAVYGLEVKTALTTSDIPLPTEYGGEIRELISQFGVARRVMTPYPIGMGTAKPARMGTRPAFGSIALSAAFGEKSPTVSFASLESHKIGGLVRLPREIDEQSIVPMGQFLARYGAVEFARAEDTWAFLADGTSAYESVVGVVKNARNTSQTVVLASTKTHPSDAVLADFRTLRTKVNKAALSGRLSAYYLDTTWETTLRTFNTQADPFIYIRNPDGSASFDGYPIVWTDVLQPYTTAAAADQPIVVFGALSFWWMGEHGSPRIDTSEHVFFANDQLATRFIEEIDFDYNAQDSAAAMITAAS